MKGSIDNPHVFFQCQRCGNCCRWPGEVQVTDADVTRIAEFLNLSEPEFVERYTALRADRRGLTLTSKENDECVFLDGIECTINPVKPEQCAGFPNTWNFPGWRKYCEAIPIPVD